MGKSEELDLASADRPRETLSVVARQVSVAAVDSVPFFRVEVNEVTTGPRVRLFEQEFADAVGAEHAMAVNSCTAALHLALKALGLEAGQAVLVPTVTFAATAEVVHYFGAFPILVDCDPTTLNMNLADAQRKLADLRAGRLPAPFHPDMKVVGMIPVHVGGLMMDLAAVDSFAQEHGLWVVEDAAHAFPAAWRQGPDQPWRRCGEDTAAVTCFSFYANKTITTGEGGMAVTADPAIAERMKTLSLHGLSRDAWQRYDGGGSWDYQIVEPGYKYNLTDVAAAQGIHQLRRAEEMLRQREAIVQAYQADLVDLAELELPPVLPDRIHSWHLFPIRLNLSRLSIDRNAFIDELGARGIGCSVHWRPLHLHPYYRETHGWRPEQLPAASSEWQRLISLPLFPSMLEEERQRVVGAVTEICRLHGTGTAGPRRRPK